MAKRSLPAEAVYRESLWSKVKKNRTSYMMLAPYFIVFLFVVFLPVLVSIFFSATFYNLLEAPRFTGLMNFKRLFLSDDIFIKALINTLVFAFVTGPVSYFLCLLLAWFVNDLSPGVRSVMVTAFYAPAICGNLYAMWGFIFSGDRYGLVNGMLLKLGVLREPILWMANENYNMKILIMVQLWLSLGASFLVFIAGFQTIDRELYEAGAIDGIRNRWQELYYITLPVMGPLLLFGAIIQIIVSYSVGDISQNLAGYPSVKYSAHTIVLHAMDYGTIRYEMGYASAISVVLLFGIYATNWILRGLIKRYASPDDNAQKVKLS